MIPVRTAELTGVHRFSIVERTLPDPGPGEVQALVDAVGVCGSDLHNYSEGSVGDMPSVYPMVLGHEPAGTVARTGAGVTGWSAGDRVLLEPAIYCYHCEFCRTGRHNVCAHLRFMSQPGDPGFFRERVNVPVESLLPLPDGMGAAEATLFEPLAVALHSMLFAQPRPGENFAVFGAGPIGLVTIAVLRLAGAGRIWAVDPVAHRRELARHAGADAGIDPASVDPVAEVLGETGRRGADCAIDCAAKGDSVNQCLRLARNAGRVVVTGIPSEARVTLEFHLLRRKELALYNVRRSNRDSETAVRLMRERPALFGPLVTHVRPLDDIGRTFSMLECYSDGVGKAVVSLR